ncbi:MAG: primosomal protein N' [Psittacicella sp.]
MKLIKVAIKTNFDYDFYYFANNDIKIKDLVIVPFGNKNLLGVVIEDNIKLKNNLKFKIKSIIKKVNISIFQKNYDILQWVSNYYLLNFPQIISGNIPAYLSSEFKKAFKNLENIDEFQFNLNLPSKLKANTKSIINPSEITLTSHQEKAYKEISSKKEGTFLLEGVTGSGKTEVYLKLIEDSILKSKQVLILVPEIGLIDEFLQKLNLRFNVNIAKYHSKVTPKKKLEIILNIQTKLVDIVIGTRSSLFLPFANLDLIIVDEEHDSSYYQFDDDFNYNGKNIAVVASKIYNSKLILGSATPSFQTLSNALNSKYQLIQLPKRVYSKGNITHKVIDLNQKSLKYGLSDESFLSIKKHLKNNKQVMIFINKKGYSPVLFCHKCSWKAVCLNCNKTLKYFKSKNILKCSHCKVSINPPKICPECKSEDGLIPVGFGTERVAENLSKFFNYPIEVFDKESLTTSEFNKKLNKIKEFKASIIIGTQMIAKGHNLPNLTLCVMLNMDYVFYSQDYKAQENFTQTYTQVAGRAGRFGADCEIIIETYHPKNEFLTHFLQNGYHKFSISRLNELKEYMLPPFSREARIRISNSDQNKVCRIYKNILLELDKFQEDDLIVIESDKFIKKLNKYYRVITLLHNSRAPIYKALKHIYLYKFNKDDIKNTKITGIIDPIGYF